MSSCSFPQFETLRTEEFDLVIVSAWLGEWDRGSHSFNSRQNASPCADRTDAG
jgi:hypothetical protein